jgi:hypothetical protein
METGSCSRRCMPSLRSKATQRRRNVQGSGHGEWALSAAWRQKHRAAHAGRARTVATGSPRAWLLHGGSESRTGRGALHNASASMAPVGSKVGVTGFSLTSPADNLATVTGAHRRRISSTSSCVRHGCGGVTTSPRGRDGREDPVSWRAIAWRCGARAASGRPSGGRARQAA